MELPDMESWLQRTLVLEARDQVLNPLTTNLIRDWRLPLGCGGASVLVLSRLSHSMGHGALNMFDDLQRILLWFPSWLGLDCRFPP